ncbi:hypothetical protein MO867_14700 [Microbulbifer sp. OS29]|uniref:Uncharacterized protein n=1 Tax=Microbulbifer okhotskensis TaxID=2926617 RepID=A0A9X2ETN4_9GAMM|nr:hypothetical protein [Microbulbifer okhotskensis]MCO1335586.1 hypothetical protein [Microbulbifer okhotskensis]
MNNWEHQYYKEAEALASPPQLDDEVFKTAQTYKPKANLNHLVSRATVSCSVVIAILLLVHPAQYLGALTHQVSASDLMHEPVLRDWKDTAAPSIPKEDPWLKLRNQIHEGEYVALCHYWRAEQKSVDSNPLPQELRKSAKRHCRILPHTASRN